MTRDSDEKAVEVMARAIATEIGYPADKPLSKDTRIDTSGGGWVYPYDLARAALDAYLKHCAGTMNEIVMGEGGDAEDGEKETRN